MSALPIVGAAAPVDRLGRALGVLRISVTDRCNLRCSYCMPEADYTWLPRPDILTFEELVHIAVASGAAGVRKLRLTGGEPLVRTDVPRLVEMLRAACPQMELALTSNGVLLADHAEALRRAGLDRLTVSLDTLEPERFQRLTGRDDHRRVLAGLDAIDAAGFAGTKLNTVVMRGVNDDELPALVEHARRRGAEQRFIEYMDVGGATGWRGDAVVSRGEILASLIQVFGAATPVGDDATAPAERFTFADGTTVGIIASTTAPFCRTCDRLRLTADGVMYTCLYASQGLDLRTPLRAGADSATLEALLRRVWGERRDRGAEERAELRQRGPWATAPNLRADPHLEMHTRGG